MKTLLTSFLLFCLASPVWADYVSVYTPPNANTQAGGLEFLPYPTYQQLFTASLFSSIPAGGGTIRGLVLRASRQSLSTVGSLDGISIEFSTTSKTADSLSPVFAENLGLDNSLYWSGSDETRFGSGKLNGLQIWGLGFTLPPGRGFHYDPSKGNLLMTIRNLHFPTDQQVYTSLDGIHGSPFTASVQSLERGATSGTVSPDALVVWLAFFDVVPEPSMVAFVALAVAVAGWASRSTRSQKDRDVVD